jgi:uncharacterized coiled-coil DUF342 family protein
MGRKPTDIVTKVQEEFPEFSDVVQGLSINELEQKVAVYAKEFEKTCESLDSNEKIAQAREGLAEMVAPYRDTKRAIRMKIKYLIAMIKEKGGDV